MAMILQSTERWYALKDRRAAGLTHPGESERKSCPLCGSRNHVSASKCPAVDDNPPHPELNGPYRGALPVRILPPGFSFRHGVGELGPRVRLAQRWTKDGGATWVVEKLEGQLAQLRCGLNGARTQIKTHELRRRWYCLQVTRG